MCFGAYFTFYTLYISGVVYELVKLLWLVALDNREDLFNETVVLCLN